MSYIINPYSVTAADTDLLLDDYSGALGAYGLRKLDKDYSGSAIRVRESLGSTEADIGFDGSGDLDTTALLAHTSSNDGFITKWYDQSGNGNDMVQATAVNQPTIVLSGSTLTNNSKPCINFDSIQDFLKALSTGTTTSTTSAIFMVVALESSGGSYRGFFSAREGAGNDYSTGFNIGVGSATQTSFKYLNFEGEGFGGASDLMTSDIAFDTQTLMTCTMATGTCQLHINGTSETSRSNDGSAKGLENLQIGARFYAGATLAFIDADYQEVIVYPTDQTSNRTGIETNINDYYSIY